MSSVSPLPSNFPVEALQSPYSSKHLTPYVLFQDSSGYLIICPSWYLLPQAAVTGSFAVKCPPLSYFSALRDFLVRQKTNQPTNKKCLCVSPSGSPQLGQSRQPYFLEDEFFSVDCYIEDHHQAIWVGRG